MELCCQHICFSSLKFWRSSWYFHPGVDAYEYILGSIKVNLPPQLCWTTHSSRKIPTTEYDTKYGKYLQQNMTQNTETWKIPTMKYDTFLTENTYNEIWHKIRKHKNTYNKIWHKIRKIPTTKYDTKYRKYLQQNTTQNTETWKIPTMKYDTIIFSKNICSRWHKAFLVKPHYFIKKSQGGFNRIWPERPIS